MAPKIVVAESLDDSENEFIPQNIDKTERAIRNLRKNVKKRISELQEKQESMHLSKSGSSKKNQSLFEKMKLSLKKLKRWRYMSIKYRNMYNDLIKKENKYYVFILNAIATIMENGEVKREDLLGKMPSFLRKSQKVTDGLTKPIVDLDHFMGFLAMHTYTWDWVTIQFLIDYYGIPYLAKYPLPIGYEPPKSAMQSLIQSESLDDEYSSDSSSESTQDTDSYNSESETSDPEYSESEFESDSWSNSDDPDPDILEFEQCKPVPRLKLCDLDHSRPKEGAEIDPTNYEMLEKHQLICVPDYSKLFQVCPGIKPSSVIIHWAYNAVRTDPFLRKFMEYLGYSTELKIEDGYFGGRDSLRVDFALTTLRIALEINEKSHKNKETQEKDAEKEGRCRIKDFYFFAFDITQIGKCFNESAYVEQFRKNLIYATRCALLSREEDTKPHMKFLEMLIKGDAERDLKRIKAKITSIKNLIKETDDESNVELMEKLEKKIAEKDILFGMIDNPGGSYGILTQITKLRVDSYHSEHGYTISINQIMNLLQMSNFHERKELIRFIREEIFEWRGNFYDGKISWEELDILINDCDLVLEQIRESMKFYYQKSIHKYEKIIKMMRHYNTKISWDDKICGKYENGRLFRKFTNLKNQLKSAKNENSTLNKKLQKATKKIQKLESSNSK